MLDRELVIGLFLTAAVGLTSYFANKNFRLYEDPNVYGTTRWVILGLVCFAIFGFLNLVHLPRNKYSNYLVALLFAINLMISINGTNNTSYQSKLCLGILLFLGFSFVTYEEFIKEQ